MESKKHWENVYHIKQTTEVSWFQVHPEKSMELIRKIGVSRDAEIIDVGGGASTLVDDLLANQFEHVTVLDISGEALAASQSRLGEQASKVTWIESDITQANLPGNRYDIWHDRALFHFLVGPEDRQKYLNKLRHALKINGHVIMATFSLEGPLRCSGLEVVRYSPESLCAEFGSGFSLIESFPEKHITPSGNEQNFIYCHFKKIK